MVGNMLPLRPIMEEAIVYNLEQRISDRGVFGKSF